MEGNLSEKAAGSIKKFIVSFDKKSVATGIITGVVTMLGLSVSLPDTAHQFSQEVRGHGRKRKDRHLGKFDVEGDKQLIADTVAQETAYFAKKVEDGRAGFDPEIKR